MGVHKVLGGGGGAQTEKIPLLIKTMLDFQYALVRCSVAKLRVIYLYLSRDRLAANLKEHIIKTNTACVDTYFSEIERGR